MTLTIRTRGIRPEKDGTFRVEVILSDGSPCTPMRGEGYRSREEAANASRRVAMTETGPVIR